MWTSLTRTVDPVGDVLTLDELKAHLRVSSDDVSEDDLLAIFLAAAVEDVDGPQGIGVALLPQSWRATLACWPRDGLIRVPLAPVVSIDAIAYVDPAGSPQTLDPSAYLVDLGRKPVLVQPAPGTAWPTVRAQTNAITVDFTCGYPDAADVPKRLKSGILLKVGDLYANREAVVIDASRVTCIENPTAERLLAPYRVYL